MKKGGLANAASTALRSITITPELAAWTRDAVTWWTENRRTEDDAAAVALAKQIREAETKLKRLTDLVISGTLTETEYVARKEALQLDLIELRARATDPSRPDRDWQVRVEKILSAGTTCLDVFNSTSIDARRLALAHVYPNVTVEHGLPRFSLGAEYLALADVPIVHAGVPAHAPNFPRPEECWQPSKKAAGRSKIVAAFSLWCPGKESNLHP